MKKKIKNTNSSLANLKKISETDSDLVLISLQKVIKCDTYGLC